MRSIPEDPAAFYTPDVLEGLDPETWDDASDAWAQASLALGATIQGRLFGAVLGLVPDRHRWRAMVVESGDGRFVSNEAWRDPTRCLLAARARFATDVLDEAGIWQAGGRLGLDGVELSNVLRKFDQMVDPESDGSPEDRDPGT